MRKATLETRQGLFDALQTHNAHLFAFDNGGTTTDRYTIYVYHHDLENFTVALTASDDCGIWQHFDGDETTEKDKKINISELSESIVQKLIGEINDFS